MKNLMNRITAIVAMIFSALSIIEGSRVLLKVSVPDYIVFTPLLIYNIILGAVGVYIGILILRRHKLSLRYSIIVTFFHVSVLITVSLLYLFSSFISDHSVNAMLVRVVVWLIITITVSYSNKHSIEQKGKS